MSSPDMSPLFAPFQLKGLTLKSRFVMAPMQRSWVDDGVPRESYIPYFRDRVRHGIGLAMTEATAVPHPSAISHPTNSSITPEASPLWRRVTDAVHAEDGHIFMQLHHGGPFRTEGVGKHPEQPSLSASGVIKPEMEMYGRAATIAELDDIRAAYAAGARFAMEAGFDGVEVNGAHGYLLHSFLWSETNQRDDKYGGATLAERARYPAEVVRAIRAEIGPDVPISYRISQWSRADFASKIATDPNDLGEFVAILEDAGVDLFNTSTRRFYDVEWPGSNLGFAGHMKAVASVPVIAIGSVGLDLDMFADLGTDAESKFGGQAHLEQLLSRFEAGEFDLVAVGRSMIADAEWPSKILNGKFEDIRVFSKADLMREP